MRRGTRHTICLVSPGHLGSNPRLVKEADALTEAGYQVHVIYGETHPPALVRDAAILRRADWGYQAVSALDGGLITKVSRLRFRLARMLVGWGLSHSAIARFATHPLYPRLLKAARRSRADLYIGHCLPSLPVVVTAAAGHRAKCGFDAEDFHSAECVDDGTGRISNRVATLVERRYLPRAAILTASSPLIAEEYRKTYGVSMTSILNVFPLSEAVAPKLPVADVPSFYWFSQTIGPGRGLEEFIDIAGRLERPVRVALRGEIREEFRKVLEDKVENSQLVLELLPPRDPGEMVACAAGHTAGLALEQSVPLNRDLCFTNKAFTYLLSGTPVIFSRTRAQELFAADLGEAGLLIDLRDRDAAVVKLASWLDSDDLQGRARVAAYESGRKRYNWDTEKLRYLARIETVLTATE